MRTHSLNTLVWVVRLGSLSAAAEHLNVTQSAVTRRIQELERDLHVKLFQRTGRLMTPTPAAHAIVPKAERVLSEITGMRVAARGGATLRGKVRIGIAELIGLTWFDRLLLRLKRDFPNVTIEIRVDVASHLIEGLNRHKLDVAFLSGSAPAKGLSQVTIGARTLRWVAHPELIGTRDLLSPLEIADLPIILMPEGAEWHDVVMRWFATAGIRPQRLNTCNSLSVQTSLVRKGLAITAMPLDLISEELANGTLITLPESPALPRVSYSAAYLESESVTIMPQIVNYAREESQFPHADGP